MATNTYVELRTQTVAVATNTVTFDLTGISGYTDLRVVINSDVTTGIGNINMRYNGDSTSTLYSGTFLTGTGSSSGVTLRSQSANEIILNYYGYMEAGTPTSVLVDIFQFANTNVFKVNSSRANNTANGLAANIGMWRNTSAITSVTFITGSNNFTVGSTFSLYGIRAEGVTPAPKATGGAIYSDADYYYHVFGATGAFVPSQTLSCQYLVVAGGGGGGGNNTSGGGGGAGGYRSAMTGQLSGALSSPESAVSLVSGTSYTVTIGGGGGGGTSAAGTNGTASSIIGGAVSISATGGGGGGAGNGQVGGSGGGGSGQTSAGVTGAAGTSLQGFAGGNGLQTSSNYSAGGGGGAGAVGSNGISQYGGNGGAGITANLYGSVTFAGGGGGGNTNDAGGPISVAGGLGAAGGGNGARGSSTFGAVGLPAIQNTGSGGGGGATHTGVQVYGGGAGGSGIVMIRYLKA
jgi:hypothetical protein